jgi:hypothetical protein
MDILHENRIFQGMLEDRSQAGHCRRETPHYSGSQGSTFTHP